MSNTTPNGLQGLIGDALRETNELARKEIALFRNEMTSNVRSLFVGLALLVGAAVFGVVALFVLVDALVKWLATVVHSEALAALIVGGVLLVVAVLLALVGRNAMSLSTLAPVRTSRQVRQDARVLSEKVSG
ncbi:phage holin family protein [Methylobacterium gossipiicola]|uniref:Putative Holin-X, holin superfamily III n=1 Tax=Methylobacterium gossipiicola TaxID=582675 RepID=A0A1I2S6W5_9HYPH|nr:phage holin family protein [Methylobacterium gossipiicola]SFG48558.1 Putative Holin-X, holin superfamily III [Methylobacterium gossipiicola]